ncbi:MAG: SRPBCC family protein [Candidatus Acidiferrales bacterium]
MATPNANSGADEIVSEIQIAAPPERVFEALVAPKQVVQWWGQKGIYVCKEFEADLRVGGTWRSAGVDGRGNPFEISGEFVEIDRPRTLAYTWVATWTGDLKTLVRWELAPTTAGTLVRIRHSGFGGRPEMGQNYRGWPRMLGWLQALMERSETVEERPAASWG